MHGLLSGGEREEVRGEGKIQDFMEYMHAQGIELGSYRNGDAYVSSA